MRPPRTLRPTRAGWAFFVLLMGVGVATILIGNNLLHIVFALMLSFLVLSGLLSEAVLRDIRVKRHLPQEAFAGQPAAMAIEIENPHLLMPAYALVLEDYGLMQEEGASPFPVSRIFILHVAAGSSKTRTYSMNPPNRGPCNLLGFRISTRFPFGLFSKALFLEEPDQMMIYPGLHRGGAAHHLVRDPGDESTQQTQKRLLGPEASQVRPYETGDSQRRIHWPSTMRRGEILVRAGETSEAYAAEVVLNTSGVEPGKAFEYQVCRATTEVIRLLQEGVEVGLRTDTAILSPRDTQRSQLLRFLALVQPEPSMTQGASTAKGQAA
ncbi:MAG: DUF58 domain-containing protein [Deltaproteobacteria bacterium]|nr:DUF58 domain-containing protein [Deltaproteobacteria bacterium]